LKAHKFLNKKMFSNENFNAFKVVNESKVYLFQKAYLSLEKINIYAALNKFNFHFLTFSYREIYELSNGTFPHFFIDTFRSKII
jgi:hypothetical protein